jgi:hypothetical protein
VVLQQVSRVLMVEPDEATLVVAVVVPVLSVVML